MEQSDRSGPRSDTGRDGDVESLVGVIYEEEEARRAAALAAPDLLPDDLLPGVGAKAMTLREGLRVGGVLPVASLAMLSFFETIDRVALQVLAPDIQDTLNVSDTVLAGLGSLGGVLYVGATIPAAWLGDRFRRSRVLAAATGIFSFFIFVTGLVVNAFQMALVRMGSGIGGGAGVPLVPSILSDAYPIGVRTRIFALDGMARPAGSVLGPLAAGAIAYAAGGEEGWRWTFIILAIPPAVGAAFVWTLREPERGRWEKQAVLDSDLETTEPPVRISAAFQRLKSVRTFYFLATGIGVLGFALVSVPLLIGLLLEEEYGYDALQRGWILSIAASGALLGIPLAGLFGDRWFRQDPSRALRLSGGFIMTFGALVTLAVRFHEPVIFIGLYTLAGAFSGAGFTIIGPTIAATVPPRMRSQAFSVVGIYVFLMGGFFGGLLAGAFSDSFGERTALTVVVPPATLIGGLLIVYGSRFMRNDISLVVEEMLEEQAEQARIKADPDNVPVLQVHNLDVSYGPVQVLFGVDLEVRRGEVLALLGTNGAGKSTLLRAVSGLALPDRGNVRLNGRTITLVDPDLRPGLGIVQVPGSSSLFPSLTVQENIDVWCLPLRDRAERDRRLERIHETFPVVRERANQRAGSLSGGQQRQLALSYALLHDPEVLLIDELSLGLAPIVVQELLVVIEQLKATGMTMVIVEQSVNVALSIADTAVFLERGRVRYSGAAQELLERDDLLRAVFLSGDGA